MQTLDIQRSGAANPNLAPLIRETLEEREEGAESPEIVEHFKNAIKNSTVHYLQSITILTSLGQAPTASWEAHVSEFVEGQVGPDASPAAKLAAEQALILHHAICTLRQSTAGVLNPEIVRTNHALANQMSTELRRLLKDLEELRESQASTHKTGSTAKSRKNRGSTMQKVA